jgi:hypothetical protein
MVHSPASPLQRFPASACQNGKFCGFFVEDSQNAT